MSSVRVVGYRGMGTLPGIEINTTSRSKDFGRGLSPFLVGPCRMYPIMHRGTPIARNVENAWQYSKVYAEHINPNTGWPSSKYYDWAIAGWQNPRAERYPMGKGARPEYSYWDSEKLGYLEARRRIYVPLYAQAVVRTQAYQRLKALYDAGNDIVLVDFDGYDHVAAGMTYRQVLDSPDKKMGHAFVLAMLLDRAIEVK